MVEQIFIEHFHRPETSLRLRYSAVKKSDKIHNQLTLKWEETVNKTQRRTFYNLLQSNQLYKDK